MNTPVSLIASAVAVMALTLAIYGEAAVDHALAGRAAVVCQTARGGAHRGGGVRE